MGMRVAELIPWVFFVCNLLDDCQFCFSSSRVIDQRQLCERKFVSFLRPVQRLGIQHKTLNGFRPDFVFFWLWKTHDYIQIFRPRVVITILRGAGPIDALGACFLSEALTVQSPLIFAFL